MKLHRLVPAVVWGALLAAPNGVSAQGPVLEARIGMAWHGAAPCGPIIRDHGWTAGMEIRTPGPWIVSGAADLQLTGYGCFDIASFMEYDGQVREVRGSYPLGRVRGAAGRAFGVGGFRAELTAGAGLAPNSAWGDAGDLSWDPWYGGTLTVRPPSSGWGVQLEIGRHRVHQRLYVVETDVQIAEPRPWERLIRLGVTFPLW